MDSSSDPLVRKQAGVVLSHTYRSPSRPVSRPTSRTTSPSRKPAPRQSAHPLASKPAPRPVATTRPAEPAIPYTPQPAPRPAEYSPIEMPVSRPITPPAPQPVDDSTPISFASRLDDRPAFVEHIESQPKRPALVAYSPSSSPFIDNAEHSKRPLGEVSRATMLLGDDPTYDPALDPRRKRESDPVRKAPARKKLTIPLPLIVVITIILGIASGVGVYFLLSK